jgi:hypothetical protein
LNKERAVKELEYSLRELTEQLNAKWTVIVEQNDRVTKKTIAAQLEKVTKKDLLVIIFLGEENYIRNPKCKR